MEKTFDRTAFLTFLGLVLEIIIIAAVGLNVSANKADEFEEVIVIKEKPFALYGAGIEHDFENMGMQDVDLAYSAGVSGIMDAALADDETDDGIALEDEWGYVNLGLAQVEDHLNVRAIPATDGRMLGKMSNNAACEILGISDGWAHIVSGSVEGYVSMDYLVTGQAAKDMAAQVVSEVATVNTTTLKVRGQPSTESEVITMIPYGENLDVDSVADGWVKFELDDEYAYVSADYVDIKRSLKTAITMKELLYGDGISDTRVELCKLAQKSVGRPYVWGGVSLTKGADCSGFVMSVFKQFGVSLPHSSVAQANCGTKIKMSEAKPGDLIFYAKGGRINHVAIYLGGNQVVHASSPKTGIKVSNAHYREPYAVRRILND